MYNLVGLIKTPSLESFNLLPERPGLTPPADAVSYVPGSCWRPCGHKGLEGNQRTQEAQTVLAVREPWQSLVLRPSYIPMGFLVGPVVKNLPFNAGDTGLSPGSGRSPRKGNGNPLQYSCLEKSLGQRNLVGYSPWGHKRDMT